MRVLTRGDLDGLTSCVLLTYVEKITEVRLAHPKDVQDGKVPCGPEDIIVNLPFVPGCGLWFDHHVSEQPKLDAIGDYKGKFAVAPSCARVIYEYYARPEFEAWKEMLEATDRLDAAQLTFGDVANPADWILLGYTLDPRTGLGPGFEKYFRWLVEYVKEVPLAKILQHPEVKKRVDRVLQEQEEFKALLLAHSKQIGNVVVTDFRDVQNAPVGNRFLVYTLFPTANVEARIHWGKERKTVNLAIGHSIFNRTCEMNVGVLCNSYGGGGHVGAGTCQLPIETAEAKIQEVIGKLQDGTASTPAPAAAAPAAAAPPAPAAASAPAPVKKPAAPKPAAKAPAPKPAAKKRPAAKNKRAAKAEPKTKGKVAKTVAKKRAPKAAKKAVRKAGKRK